MKKAALARRLARVAKTSHAEAADYLDQSVLSILKLWKHGQPADWPGLGLLTRDGIKSSLKKFMKTEAP